MDLLLGLVRVITFWSFLFPVDAGPSPTLPNPYFCFRDNPQSPCVPSVEYPLERTGWSSYSCGFPGFEVDCNLLGDGKAFINISKHIYYVLQVDYKFKTIRLVDNDVERSGGGCPQPTRNFSFPSSPSWVKSTLFGNDGNITIFYNCRSVPVEAKAFLLCSEEDTNTPPSYAFYNDESRAGFDWYGNCAQNVVVPYYVGNSGSASAAIKRGFLMEWSATDWCEDCERSGGRCWSIHNSTATGCACEDYQSYNRTCPPRTPPPHQGCSCVSLWKCLPHIIMDDVDGTKWKDP